MEYQTLRYPFHCTITHTLIPPVDYLGGFLGRLQFCDCSGLILNSKCIFVFHGKEREKAEGNQTQAAA
jgi:hypothetical protein